MPERLSRGEKKALWLSILELLALALFLWQRGIPGIFLWSDSPWAVRRLLFLGLACLAAAAVFLLLRSYSRLVARWAQRSPADTFRDVSVSFSPLLLLYIGIVQNFVFLNDISGTLLLVSLGGCLILQAGFLASWKREKPPGPTPLGSPSGYGLFFFVAFIAYALLASGLIVPAHPLTGDEPHYLLITKSLLADGDINISNNYRDQDYLDFYGGRMEPHMRAGKSGPEFQYSRHSPLLSLLLVPAYFLGEKTSSWVLGEKKDSPIARRILVFFCRLPMCLAAALLGWLFLRLLLSLTGKRGVSLSAGLLFSFAPPLLFYSSLIYPEVLMALIALLVCRHLLTGRMFTTWSLLGMGAGIALSVWLGIKYIPLAAAMFGLVIFYLWKERQGRWRKLLIFFLPQTLLGCGFLFFLWSLYGNLSPFSMYIGTFPSNYPRVPFFHGDLWEALRCALIYFFDQRIGIFAYAPFLILAVPGFFLLNRRNRRAAWLLFGIFALFWAYCSLTYYWGGYCPPARPLLPVSWMLSAFLAFSLDEARSWGQKFLQWMLLLLTFLMVIPLLKSPLLLYHQNLSFFQGERGTWSNLLTSWSGVFVDYRNFIPQLTDKNNILWLPLAAWIVGVAAITAVFLRPQRASGRGPGLSFRALRSAVLILGAVTVAAQFFAVRLDEGAFIKNRDYGLYFQDGNHYGEELGGFWTRGKSPAAVFLRSPQPISQIVLSLFSPVPGKARVQVGNLHKTVARTRNGGGEKVVTVSSPLGFPWKGGYLYYLKIQEGRGFVPAERNPDNRDSRHLGIFVKISLT